MFVYIAPLEESKMFKIGKSNNPKKRFEELSEFYKFDYKNITLIECNTSDEAIRVEATLQQVCKKYKTKIATPGGTEFFSNEIYEKVLNLVQTLANVGSYKVTNFDVKDIVIFKKINDKDIDIKALIGDLISKIRNQRLKLNLTQEKVASLVGITRQTLIRLESSGEGSIENLLKVLKVLKIEGELLKFESFSCERKRAKQH